MSFADLPEHLIISIYESLSVYDKLQLSCACWKLREAVFYPTLWNGYQLYIAQRDKSEHDEVSSSVVLFFEHVPNDSLHSLIWKLDNQYLNRLLSLCVNHRNSLNCIHIVDDKLSNEQLQIVCESLSENGVNHCLERIGIAGSEVVTGESLMTLAKCFPRLNGLDFSYTHRITDEQFSDFLKLFPEKQLKKVNLDNVNWLEDTSISFLCNKHASTLTHLNIDGENNTDNVFGPISRCYNLTSIVVNFSQGLTDAALDALSEKQIFTEICFRKGSNFTEEGLNQLLLTLDLSNLNVLNLSECSNLTNSGALLIAAHCKNLTNLSLCWCWEIDDVGILPIVTECSKMVEMDLTGMHKLTGHSFLVIPVKMPKLTLLKLEMCNDVDDEVLHMVVIQMRGKLEIINYYYETIVYDPNADDNERVLLF